MVSSAQTWKNGRSHLKRLSVFCIQKTALIYEFHLMKLATGFPKLSLAADSKTSPRNPRDVSFASFEVYRLFCPEGSTPLTGLGLGSGQGNKANQ